MVNVNAKFNLTVLKIRLEDNILFVMNKKLELYSINRSGWEIYKLISENNSLDQIVIYLSKSYNISQELLLSDVENFIERLLEYQIIEVDRGEEKYD
ncbi:MAG: PqqD family protein [Clostridia bacterium]|nr:PqqD family protein [Clostridia bacterium]